MIAKSSSPGVFKWGHTFQRGDLPIYVADSVGSPFSPYAIRYTLLFQSKCSTCITKVWPCGRMPVQADIGEYYGTGCAGEGGQPGQWFIEWTLQEYFDGPLMTDRFGFEVFNTADFCPQPHQYSGAPVPPPVWGEGCNSGHANQKHSNCRCGGRRWW